jgi:hypothetical protein
LQEETGEFDVFYFYLKELLDVVDEMDPAFSHNLLILKEKRLLFLEQPNQNSGGIPRGGAGGICIALVLL